MGAGRRSNGYRWSYLTSQFQMRQITAPDDTAENQEDSAAYVIDMLHQKTPKAGTTWTTVDGVSVPADYEPTTSGHENTLVLYFVGDGQNITFELWIEVSPEGYADTAQYESSSEEIEGECAGWALIDEVASAFDASRAFKFDRMPAGRYKVVVTAIDSGEVCLVEQHTE